VRDEGLGAAPNVWSLDDHHRYPVDASAHGGDRGVLAIYDEKLPLTGARTNRRF
jgi:hypothetical protein